MVDFSTSSTKFKSILKKTNSNQESNVRPLWFNNYRLKKITYQLPDFPFWEFDVVYNEIKNSRWNSFKTKMLSSPYVKLKMFRNKNGWVSETLVIDKNSRFSNILPITTTDNTANIPLINWRVQCIIKKIINYMLQNGYMIHFIFHMRHLLHLLNNL